MAYGLAYAHMEDYGLDLVQRLVRARGELSLRFGRDSVESDFWWRRRHHQAVTAYDSLHPDARALYGGYAAGVNRYMELHPDEFPDWAVRDYTGPDIAAHWADESFQPHVDRFLESQEARRRRADSLKASGDGSNAWAFGPGRTNSGNAILVRNPHLRWGSGYYGAYYEAQITVPGIVDFYGDFRVGYPMYFNGGFNRHLGWATTNNSPDVDEVYVLEPDPDRPNHYLFEGESVPLDRQTFTVEFMDEGRRSSETRDFWSTVIGPVIDRDEEGIYVMRSSDWSEFRRTEQFLRMMQATSLEEWKAAMRMRAMTESSFTYADAAGNIYYVWNAALPVLPQESGGDTVATPARGWSDVWTEIVPFDSLPQLLNPPGGYIHNENDSFHYTNLNAPLDEPSIPAAWQERRLRLRSQLALELVAGDNRMSLEEVIRLKHSPRMLLADRVKADLVAAVSASRPSREAEDAIAVVEAWENTSTADSRGGVLFLTWWSIYSEGTATPFAAEWTEERPTETPVGLGDPGWAAAAFEQAVQETRQEYGRYDVSWGEVHRIRWGDVDVPASGCPAWYGCFRHLGFRTADDGKRVAYTGDAYILAVEFSEIPRAYTILVFGQSSKADSPHLDDQTEMFARGELKPVAFTEEEIEAQLVRRYRPGVEP
jgi:acyl-homoserine-lactone acylase